MDSFIRDENIILNNIKMDLLPEIKEILIILNKEKDHKSYEYVENYYNIINDSKLLEKDYLERLSKNLVILSTTDTKNLTKNKILTIINKLNKIIYNM